jgi:hypothetical protein
LPLKYNYTAFPLDKPNPTAPQQFAWRPVLPVVLFANHRQSMPIRSIVDTGADGCVFHGQIGDSLGLDVRSGVKHGFGGMSGVQVMGYMHKVRIQAAGSSYETVVSFCYELAMVGILGQAGFFDHFIATFDWTPNPPTFELQRIPQN